MRELHETWMQLYKYSPIYCDTKSSENPHKKQVSETPWAPAIASVLHLHILLHVVTDQQKQTVSVSGPWMLLVNNWHENHKTWIELSFLRKAVKVLFHRFSFTVPTAVRTAHTTGNSEGKSCQVVFCNIWEFTWRRPNMNEGCVQCP